MDPESISPEIITPSLPEWQAELVAIYISPGHDYWGKHGEGRLQNGIQSPDEVECVAGTGLRGDRYFAYRPDYKGQVTFFSAEIVDEVRAHFKLPRLPASVFRRNLIVRGVELKEWMGKRFRLQGVEFEGSQECRPCHWMDRVIADGGEDFLKGGFRGGLRAKILSDGILRVK
ncbi:MAG: MOSC domain-containing protein [Verrucomicrobiota bacterium]